MSNDRRARAISKPSAPLLIGFVPMIDCAPLIAAQELGLFSRHGLKVVLQREIGWATVREKLLHDELHAVHAPASLAFVIRCGIGVVARPCLTAFILSLNGSAITLSRELWEKEVRDAASLKALIDRERSFRTYRIGAVHEFSTQHYNLRRWLIAGGIDPDRDLQIPIIPSPVIHRGLLDGHLDGYCVAEPWNTAVTESGEGWVVATSAQIAPRQPEKVLLVLEKFTEEQPEEHAALLAALMEASLFCEEPANRPELIRMLAQPSCLNVPASLLAPSLLGPFPLRAASAQPDFITFHQHDANVPTRAKGREVFQDVQKIPAARACRSLRPEIISRVFREDLYHHAARAARLAPEPLSDPLLPPRSALAFAL